MRLPVEFRSASNDNYKRFCKEHPEVDITMDEWRSVLYTYLDLFKEHILETGEKAKLPAGWGEYSIEKRQRKRIVTFNGKDRVNLPIDWARSKVKHKRIYHLNYHTEGFTFRWRWFRETAKFRQSGIWFFKPARPTSRLIAHYIKVDENYQHKYLEWGR